MSATWVNLGLLVLALLAVVVCTWLCRAGKIQPRVDDRADSKFWDDQSAP